jgi:hypothetical protein
MGHSEEKETKTAIEHIACSKRTHSVVREHTHTCTHTLKRTVGSIEKGVLGHERFILSPQRR